MPPHQQLQQRPPYAQPGYGPGPGYGPPPAQQMPHAQMGYGPGPGGPHGLLPGLPPNTNVDGGPGCVLHVSVVDCYYPVTIDILHTVFQPYGPVIRIVLVNKKTAGYVEAPGNLQALVQFSDAELANAARMVGGAPVMAPRRPSQRWPHSPDGVRRRPLLPRRVCVCVCVLFFFLCVCVYHAEPQQQVHL